MFHLCLVSVLFHPYLKQSFAEPFPLVSVLFGGFLSRLPNKAHLVIVFATHLRTRYHTADEMPQSLAMKVFCAGDEHFSAGNGLVVLEMIT